MSTLYLPASDEASIQRQLAELDDRLILTRERDRLGRDYYVVIYYQGGTQAPDVVVDWRDGDKPQPLNSALPNEIRKMMHDGGVNLAKIREHNDALKAAREATYAEAYEDIAVDVQRSEKRSAVLHRGVGLQRARERERARYRR